MATRIPLRSKLNQKYTWNAESVFASDEAWEKEVNQLLEELPSIRQFQGHLAESPSVLEKALECAYDLIARVRKVFMYAGFSYEVDTTNQDAAGMRSRAQGVYGQVLSTIAFVQPEILSIGREKLEEWMSQSSPLAMYRHSLDDLFRKQAHVRSAEVEELLGLVSDP